MDRGLKFNCGIHSGNPPAFTRPPSEHTIRNPYRGVAVLGFVLGILHFVIIIWAVVSIFQSGESTVSKALWTALVVIFPLVGLLIWFVAGPRKD